MLRRVVTCALLATAILAVGCGSSDDSDTEADEQKIRELVAKVNQATSEKDASAFCLLIQPSEIETTFHTIDRCVNETRKILREAGDQPQLEIETIAVDGDTATVQFVGRARGEAAFVRESEQWYLPLNAGAPTEPVETDTTEGNG